MNFLKKRKGLFSIIAVFTLLLVFFVVRLVFAVSSSYTGFGKSVSVPLRSDVHTAGWNNSEVRKLQKDIFLLEQLRVLAQSDSISMVIDLSDSTVQLQLKGMELFHTKILRKYPGVFLDDLSQEAYRRFAQITCIGNEKANLSKKPVKKIQAFQKETIGSGAETANLQNAPVNWSFVTGNNVCVVITGVKLNQDSTFIMHPTYDLIKYFTRNFFNEIFPETYSPVLYLWLNDNDARAIYRAVPLEGKILFRN
ncbi:hypothetical protein D1164_03995 [Mariniphaga sediminis]|jgi:hypothetical protein|uniref:Uncharacterized protein n=1 Tax=Mariniphaga sediminis TaxID=1628158 RepID=A0A399D4C4_9BACT|nr:hypothetical protein [Mariniphaga sediminis]RIH66764.1 hypothetical protein D1164_03995 [Mariniphaga sediminis]